MKMIEAMGFLGFVFGGAAIVVLFLLGINNTLAMEDHTHPTTGIQSGAEVCVEGEAAIDYDLTTRRPFLICGTIRVEEAPPLGFNTHLAQ